MRSYVTAVSVLLSFILTGMLGEHNSKHQHLPDCTSLVRVKITHEHHSRGWRHKLVTES